MINVGKHYKPKQKRNHVATTCVTLTMSSKQVMTLYLFVRHLISLYDVYRTKTKLLTKLYERLEYEGILNTLDGNRNLENLSAN